MNSKASRSNLHLIDKLSPQDSESSPCVSLTTQENSTCNQISSHLKLLLVSVILLALTPTSKCGITQTNSFQDQAATGRRLALDLNKFGLRKVPLTRITKLKVPRIDSESINKDDKITKRFGSSEAHWSQPDPRKLYSSPVNLIKFATWKRNPNALVNSSSILQVLPVIRRLEDGQDVLLNVSSPESSLRSQDAALEFNGRATRDSLEGSSGRQNHRPLVALIKYVPVLMGIPSDQLLLPLASTAGPTIVSKSNVNANDLASSANNGLAIPQTAPNLLKAGLANRQTLASSSIGAQAYALMHPTIAADHTTRPLMPSVSINLIENEQESRMYANNHQQQSASNSIGQLQSPQLNSDFDFDYSQDKHQSSLELNSNPQNTMNQNVAFGQSSGNRAFAYLPLGGPQIALNTASLAHSSQGVSQYQQASKALGAYATKLISMLRPSTLLSTIGVQPAAGGQPVVGMGPSASSAYPLVNQSPAILVLSDNWLQSLNQPTSSSYRQRPSGTSTTMRPPTDSLFNQGNAKTFSPSQAQESQGNDDISWSLASHQRDTVCVQGHEHRSKTGTKSLSPVSKPRRRLQGSTRSSPLIDESEDEKIETTPAPAVLRSSPLNLNTSSANHPEIEAQSYIQQFDISQQLETTAKPLIQSSTKRPATSFSTRPGIAIKGKLEPPKRESPVKAAHKMTKRLQHNSSDYQSDSFDTSTRLSLDGYDDEPDDNYNDESKASYRTSGNVSALVPDPRSSRLSGLSTNRANGKRTRHLKKSHKKALAQAANSLPLIPFTIKDKIEPPQKVSVRRQVYPSGVHFDEPADESLDLQPRARKHSTPWQTADDRRAKTTFVASSTPPAASGPLTSLSPTYADDSNWSSSYSGSRLANSNLNTDKDSTLDIDYRKESGTSSGSPGFSVPMLMATSSRLSFESRLPPPDMILPLDPRVPPTSTTTARSISSEPRTNAADTLGDGRSLIDDLVKSPKLRANQNNKSAGNNNNKNLPKAKDTTSDTIELLVNSTPEATSTISTTSTDSQHLPLTSMPIPNPRPPSEASTNSTNETLSSPSSDAHNKAAVSRESSNELKGENHLSQSDSNAFSNDRSLSMEEFGRISESLQTNPLDLVDLQNSRSTFELPAQLESLSMLFSSNNSIGPESSMTPTAEFATTGSAPIDQLQEQVQVSLLASDSKELQIK